MEHASQVSEKQPAPTSCGELTDGDLMSAYATCDCHRGEGGKICDECWVRYADLYIRGKSWLEKRLMDSKNTKWRIRENLLDEKAIAAHTMEWVKDKSEFWLRKRKKDFKWWIFGQAMNEIRKESNFYKTGGISRNTTDDRDSSVLLRKAVSSKVEHLGDREIELGYKGDRASSPIGDYGVAVAEERHHEQESQRVKMERAMRATAVLELAEGLASEQLLDALKLVFIHKKNWSDAARSFGMPVSTLMSQWQTLQADVKAAFRGDLSETKRRKIASRRAKVHPLKQLFALLRQETEYLPPEDDRVKAVFSSSKSDVPGLDPREEQLERLFRIDRSHETSQTTPKLAALLGDDSSDNNGVGPLACLIKKNSPGGS